ncbi:vitamin K-dependent protein C [Rhinophrynus dorsalis]
MWWLLVLHFTLMSWDSPGAQSSPVFFSSQDANRVLKVQKRANSFLEEMKPGSLERECIEEKCDLEEAHEIFESREDTLAFWSKYFDGDQCLSNPCVNAVCKDGIGRFDCICNEGWEGHMCAYEAKYSNCSLDNGGCTHFCTDSENKSIRTCSCASGYRLSNDSHTCEPAVEFPCGKRKIVDFSYSARLTGAKQGRKGDSPWQVLIIYEKKFHCGGVLIHPYWALTAAHCLVSPGKYYVRLGEYDRRKLEDTEQQVYVSKIIPHPEYHSRNSDNDIALLRLAQPAVYNKYVVPICLPSVGLAERNLTLEGTEVVVTGWGNQDETFRNRSSILNYIQIPVAARNQCAEVMYNELTDNMLCAGRLGDKQDACGGDSGGPMVTRFGDTWFLVGLVSWGEGCGRLDNFGVYTKVSHYLEWISQQTTTFEADAQRLSDTSQQGKQMFIGRERAHHMLRRRSNSFLEEMRPGNLERECFEETCSKEEAREIFKSVEKTTEFWYHYKDLSPCKQNPCQNGGICQQYHYSYTCLCPPRYSGKHCQNVRYECWYNNGGCWQYCKDTAQALSVSCSCAQGYTLQEDGKRCAKSARFPCGLTIFSPRSLHDPDLESSYESISTERSLSDPSSIKRSLNNSRINGTEGRNQTAWTLNTTETSGNNTYKDIGWVDRETMITETGKVDYRDNVGFIPNSLNRSRVNETVERHLSNEIAWIQSRNESARKSSNETAWRDSENNTTETDIRNYKDDLSMITRSLNRSMANETTGKHQRNETARTQSRNTTSGNLLDERDWIDSKNNATDTDERNYRGDFSLFQTSLNRSRFNETSGRYQRNETAWIQSRNESARKSSNERAWRDSENNTTETARSLNSSMANETTGKHQRNETAWTQIRNDTTRNNSEQKTDWIDSANSTGMIDSRTVAGRHSRSRNIKTNEATVKGIREEEARKEDIAETSRKTEEYDDASEDDDSRIVGGMRCELGQCPWQVLIRTARGIDFCSGSLISSRWVLSAAHCFEGINPHHVTIGDNDKYRRDQDEQKIAVLQVFSHPHYLGEHYDHDIALLYLRSPAVFGEYSRPICLPSPGLGRMLTQEGEIGQVSGWGSTRYKGSASRFLLRVRLPIVSQETCMASTQKVLTGNMFCAGYSMEAKDACKGDSGGPFAVLYRNTWYLIGVVSWGEGCAEDGKYGVYTRVGNYIPWIKDTIMDMEGAEESLVSTL